MQRGQELLVDLGYEMLEGNNDSISSPDLTLFLYFIWFQE